MPLDAVRAEPGVEKRHPFQIFHPEYPGETVPERHDRRIEYAVGMDSSVPRNHRIAGIAP
ncbi:hypothetical protein SDC9_168823 [bioreactor metagenome]|uniref:Uncharacterized protein n=1 Tax=bioreactor metagenome TaxID=1076179 RepID=A0A645GBM1_9ZZZZ